VSKKILNNEIWEALLKINTKKLEKAIIRSERKGYFKRYNLSNVCPFYLTYIAKGLQEMEVDSYVFMGSNVDTLSTKFLLPYNITEEQLTDICCKFGVLSPNSVLIYPKDIYVSIESLWLIALFIPIFPTFKHIINDMDGNFIQYLNFVNHISSLIHSRRLSIIPKSFCFYDSICNIGYSPGSQFYRPNWDIFKRDFPDTIPQNFERVYSNYQLTKRLEKVLSYNLNIPYVQGLNIKDLAKFRTDEQEKFERFHQAIFKLIEINRNESDSNLIRLTFREINDSVCELNSELRKIKILKKISYISIGSFALSLGAVFTGDSVGVPISGTIGSFASLGYLAKLYKEIKFKEIDIMKSEFYIPLLLKKSK
jgi:hypothetical protein